MSEVVRCKTEEVHRNRAVLSELYIVTQVVEYDSTLSVALDLCALNHRGEVTLLVYGANTTRNCTIVRQGLVNLVANHCILALCAIQLREVLTHNEVCVCAVEVVSVDNCKWLVNSRCTHHYCVVCSPWLLTTLRYRETLWQVVQLLENIVNLYLAAKTLRGKDLLELLLERVADNEYYLTETGTDCIVNRVVNNCLVVRTNSVHLLQRSIA